MVLVCGKIEQKLCAALRICFRFFHDSLAEYSYTRFAHNYTQESTPINPHTYPHKRTLLSSVESKFYPLYTGLIITTTN